MTTPNEPNKARTIPLHIADQAVAACEAEIQKLKEENAQLKHKLGRLLGAQQEWTLVEPEHYASLKAEVERLRKAGDAMLLCLTAYVHGVPYKIKIVSECSERWIEAKEGKPSV